MEATDRGCIRGRYPPHGAACSPPSSDAHLHRLAWAISPTSVNTEPAYEPAILATSTLCHTPKLQLNMAASAPVVSGEVARTWARAQIASGSDFPDLTLPLVGGGEVKLSGPRENWVRVSGSAEFRVLRSGAVSSPWLAAVVHSSFSSCTEVFIVLFASELLLHSFGKRAVFPCG